jgi:ABC-2 type transport system ATP-binding protein
LLKGLPRQDATHAARATLESVGISGKAQAVKLGALSGGTLRRVGIAQALVNNPKILILDEPTAGLDPSQRAAFRELLARHRQHRTVVVSTHLLDDVSALADHVLVLAHGRITFSGRPDALACVPGFPTETIEARNEGWACAGEELPLS